MRDRRADEAYFARFDANAQYAIDTRAGVVHDLSKAIADPSRFASDTQRFVMGNMNKALAAYALGADLGVVREYAARAGDAWVLERETGKTYLAPDVSEVRYNFRTRRDTYVDSLQILALCSVLGVPTGKILEAAGQSGGDTLFELIASGQTSLATDAPVHLAWPRPYARLLAVFQAEESKRPKLMSAFLKVWYQQNKRVMWWNSHERIAAGGLSYGGYWCFEAAAVVKLLDIDDSSFRDNEFYPADLVHPDGE